MPGSTAAGFRRRLLPLAAAAAIASSPAVAAELVTLQTSFGEITVEPSFGARVVPVLEGLARLGLKAHVKCYAAQRGPHVRHSLHLSGQACDVLPLGRQARRRNRMPTPRLMFSRSVAALIESAGLRNGCAFRDCGHIDAGLGLRRAPARIARF